MSHVFPRVLTRALPTAVRAEGVWIEPNTITAGAYLREWVGNG